MAWYRSGTVSLTNGSTTVTGSGTAFIANASIGEGFVGPDGRTYEITDIPSNTALTIFPAYLGSTASGQGYAILPARGRIADLIAETSGLLTSFAAVRDGIGAGFIGDGLASSPALRFSADQDTGFFRAFTNTIGFAVNGAEAMRLTGDGNLGIGENNPTSRLAVRLSTGTTGLEQTFAITNGIDANCFISVTGTGASNKRAVIGPSTSTALVFQTASTERLAITGSGNVTPGSDNAQQLGGASNRWSVVYAGTGTINTSDEREKHWRGELNAAEIRAAKRIIAELGIYQWNDAVAEKGEDGARLHFGVRAQRAFDILEDEGLDWQRYAWCCHDEWAATAEPALDEHGEPTGQMRTTPAGDRYGVRPDQLAFWLIAAQAAVQADLEARLAALEAAA